MKNILVTGAGAVLGQGILRCLNEDRGKYFVHTADPEWKSAGHWLGKKAHIIPMATDPAYISEIEQIVKNENIHAILIGTDIELPIFAKEKNRLEKKYDIKIIISNEHVIEIANNKWKTAEFLKSAGMPYPYSYLTTNREGMRLLIEKNEYPYLANPVDGARSKGLFLVKNEEDLKYVSSYNNNLVVQEYLSEDGGEFTSGCSVLNGKASFVTTLKRDLRDGNTYRAFYNESNEIYTPFILEVAQKLGVEGPCNFQFRIKNKQPVIFEINARFSGTTPLRSFFGHNEVLSILDFMLFAITPAPSKLKEGIILRAWSDIFVEKAEYDKFSNQNEMAGLQAKYHPFMTKI